MKLLRHLNHNRKETPENAPTVSKPALIKALGSASMTISDELKDFVRKLPCYDYGDIAPAVYGAFCREKQECLDWENCAVCKNTASFHDRP